MLGRRHKRWVNIEPTMGERLVLAGLAVHQIYTQSDSSYVYHMYDLYTLRLHLLHASDPLYMEDEARAQSQGVMNLSQFIIQTPVRQLDRRHRVTSSLRGRGGGRLFNVQNNLGILFCLKQCIPQILISLFFKIFRF